MSYLRKLLLLVFSTLGLQSMLSAESPVRPGDHIAILGNTFADQLRAHGYLETLLQGRTTGKAVSIRNLGWGGDMLASRDRPTNFPSEVSTLTDHKTDVIIACFGMGESFAGKAGVADFKRNLGVFIDSHKGKKYNGTSEVRLILVSPIAHEDHGELTPTVDRRNEELEDYTRAMQAVATARGLPFVDLYSPTLYLMDVDGAPSLTINGIHLNDYGYWAASRILADSLVSGTSPWRIRVDAKTGKVTARGVDVSGFRKANGGLQFKGRETTPPGLGAPVRGGKIHSTLDANLDRLVVENLKPGKYILRIDGYRVATATHQQWAQGIAIDQSPTHKAAEAYRQQVNDKNLQFTYSWKALNQVHIVGERRKSPSGASLPAEVIEFNKLAMLKDKALQSGIPLKTREWRLDPQ